jgi:hypothetical protein
MFASVLPRHDTSSLPFKQKQCLQQKEDGDEEKVLPEEVVWGQQYCIDSKNGITSACQLWLECSKKCEAMAFVMKLV